MRRLWGGIYPLDGPRALPPGAYAHGSDGPAPDRQDAPRTDRLGAGGTPGLCRPVLRAGHGQTAQDPGSPIRSPTPRKEAGPPLPIFGRIFTVLWGAGKEYPVRGEDFASCCFTKGTAVSALNPPSSAFAFAVGLQSAPRPGDRTRRSSPTRISNRSAANSPRSPAGH